MSSARPTRGWAVGGLRRLAELRRAASFRTALLFFGLFGLISTCLFAFLYLQISAYALGRVDDWLLRERNGMLRGGDATLAQRVTFHRQLDPEDERPFGLFDQGGRQIAGTFPGAPAPTARYGVPYTYAVRQGRRQRDLRVVAVLLPEHVLLLAQDLDEFYEFDEVLWRALASAGALALLLGLAGAVAIGAASVRRLDAISSAIESIVSGDLSRRLPQRGGNADDLDRLIGVVNGMLDDIERLMHEVKGVCDGIAHDLRTPLARLLGGLERAQRRAKTAADYEQAVETAIRDTLSLLTTFNAMLRISEVEDGMRRSGFQAVDLATIVDDAVEYYEPSAEEKQVTLRYDHRAGLALPLRGDPSLLFEAVGNLLDNAIKFTPAGGGITVSFFDDGEAGGVRVADSGPGIPIEAREAVFRRFHRLESSRHLPGNGLGLSLVAAVARMHGMAVAIEEGAGCSISLRLARPIPCEAENNR